MRSPRPLMRLRGSLLHPSPRERSERRGGWRPRARLGGAGWGVFECDATKKRPPPLTPPRHSLREWGEGNREASAPSNETGPV